MVLNAFKAPCWMKFSVYKWAAFTALLTLGACASVESSKQSAVMPSEDSVAQVSGQTPSGKKLVLEDVNATYLYQVLAAEVMAEKGMMLDAFEIIYPLALKTRDVGLAKRAFELSMGTYDESNIDQATQLWIEVEPDEPTPWRAAYLMSLRAGDLDSAIEQWQRYRSNSPNSLQQDVLAAVQRVGRSAKPDMALAFFDYLVKANPDVWQAFYGGGFLAAQFEAYDRSVDLLKKALLIMSKDDLAENESQVYQLLSKVYLQFASPDKGLEGLKDYLKRNPSDWLVQERMARLEVKADRFTQAENRYLSILKANPSATTSRLSLALLQIELQKFPQAQANLEQVATHPGYESVGHYYLGVLSQEQGELNQALSFFEKVELQPYVVDAMLHRSEILFATQGEQPAMAVLNQIEAETVADKVKVLRAKAIFYRALQKWDESIAMYDQAIALDKENIDLLLAQSVLLYDTQRFKEYVHNLKRVLVLQPNDVDALNALGYYYAEHAIELDEAEILLKRALQLAPQSYYVLDSIGWLAYQQKNYLQAEAYLKKALAIKIDEEVLIHLVATQWQLGKTEQAKQLWAKYQSQYLNNQRYQELIQNLQAGRTIR